LLFILHLPKFAIDGIDSPRPVHLGKERTKSPRLLLRRLDHRLNLRQSSTGYSRECSDFVSGLPVT
jgi:hypothetical protein